ncbi:hypothetical protein P154DRAFT_521997 [Amniculicola lignicola CBS 123094]|uniref:Uncharacterized protein n=1 Tax=Amniculicola lignicola CBS 123094 TaxID=1392246 RepID=A0A6A5WJL9_9PLEO|nr:hypothetical protein P154DRAFT_521997 [Amniculicola lignicola CBS 123094]
MLRTSPWCLRNKVSPRLPPCTLPVRLWALGLHSARPRYQQRTAARLLLPVRSPVEQTRGPAPVSPPLSAVDSSLAAESKRVPPPVAPPRPLPERQH